VTANADGLILGGFVDVDETFLPQLSWLVPSAQSLEWQEHDICHNLPPVVRHIIAQVKLPAKLCDWETVEDDLHLFDAHIKTVPGPGYVDLVLEIHDSDVVPIEGENNLDAPHEYYDDPYALRLIVRTTEGIALVNAGLLPFPPERLDMSDPHIQLLRAVRCTRWIDFEAKLEKVLKGKWYPDPPDNIEQPEPAAKHQWEVSTSGGVDEGEASSSSGAGAASATVEGPVEGLILSPAGASSPNDTEIQIRISAAGSDRSGETLSRLGVAQRRVRFAAHHSHAGLRAFTLLDPTAPTLACIDGDGAALIDVLNPDLPRPTAQLAMTGLRGISGAGPGGIAVWGTDGAWLLSRADLSIQAYLSPASDIHAVAPVGTLVAILTSSGVDLLDDSGRRANHLDARAGTSVLTIGHRVLVGGRNGISVWDCRTATCVAVASDFDVTGFSAVPTRRLVPAILHDGTVRFFHQTRTALVPRATLRGDDWYTTASVAGLVAAQRDSNGVQLFQIGSLRHLSREQLEAWEGEPSD
jgi:hypothetical protein